MSEVSNKDGLGAPEGEETFSRFVRQNINPIGIIGCVVATAITIGHLLGERGKDKVCDELAIQHTRVLLQSEHLAEVHGHTELCDRQTQEDLLVPEEVLMECTDNPRAKLLRNVQEAFRADMEEICKPKPQLKLRFDLPDGSTIEMEPGQPLIIPFDQFFPENGSDLPDDWCIPAPEEDYFWNEKGQGGSPSYPGLGGNFYWDNSDSRGGAPAIPSSSTNKISPKPMPSVKVKNKYSDNGY